jgi:hypothetical protein
VTAYTTVLLSLLASEGGLSVLLPPLLSYCHGQTLTLTLTLTLILTLSLSLSLSLLWLCLLCLCLGASDRSNTALGPRSPSGGGTINSRRQAADRQTGGGTFFLSSLHTSNSGPSQRSSPLSCVWFPLHLLLARPCGQFATFLCSPPPHLPPCLLASSPPRLHLARSVRNAQPHSR